MDDPLDHPMILNDLAESFCQRHSTAFGKMSPFHRLTAATIIETEVDGIGRLDLFSDPRILKDGFLPQPERFKA